METAGLISYYRAHRVLQKRRLQAFLACEEAGVTGLLREEADRLREQWMGTEVHLRGIIEFSNCCRRNCAYCGLSRNNRGLTRYRMTLEEIVNAARAAAGLGFRTVVLQSGEDAFYTAEMLAGVIREIKNTGVAVTLSLGERPEQDYRLWRRAGADRYLLKFETSHSGLYARLHPEGSLPERLRCLEVLKTLGYQVGSGMIVGLPGQTAEMLAADLLLMHSLKLEMAGVGPFLPHPGTPLGAAPAGSLDLSLRVLALTRILLPWVHLPATTALGSVDRDGRRLGLTGGANVLMLNVTPGRYRCFYEIYPHKAETGGTPEQLADEARRLIREIGRRVSAGPGHGLISPVSGT